jgi:hypothetical protein
MWKTIIICFIIAIVCLWTIIGRKFGKRLSRGPEIEEP